MELIGVGVIIIGVALLVSTLFACFMNLVMYAEMKPMFGLMIKSCQYMEALMDKYYEEDYSEE